MADLVQPSPQDLVLGGQSTSPGNSLVLGGIEGLYQRLANAPAAQKANFLLQILDYGEAGIDLLVEAVHTPELVVRATACELLQLVNSPKSAILAKGLPLYPGDRFYFVYESVITYNDQDYDLYTSLEYVIAYRSGFESQPFSCHLKRSDADLSAQKLHLQKAPDLPDFCLPNGFDLQRWCIEHYVLSRQPEEDTWDFAERLRKIFQHFNRVDLLSQFWLALEQPDCDIDQWVATHPIVPPDPPELDFRDLENRDENYRLYEIWNCQYNDFQAQMVHWLKLTGNYQLLGQLWQDALGQLTFVHEEIITEAKYIDLNQFNQMNLFS